MFVPFLSPCLIYPFSLFLSFNSLFPSLFYHGHRALWLRHLLRHFNGGIVLCFSGLSRAAASFMFCLGFDFSLGSLGSLGGSAIRGWNMG